jgi:mgtE-like transporter
MDVVAQDSNHPRTRTWPFRAQLPIARRPLPSFRPTFWRRGWEPRLPLARRLAPAPRQLLALLGPDAASSVQSLVALGLNSMTSLVAGAILGSITTTLKAYPGLLVMVPAAIGMRGNVFSALGSRISTSVHLGDYRPSLARGTVLGDNVVGSLLLTAALAPMLALVAKVSASVFGVEGRVSFLELTTIALLGGLLASGIVLVATLGLVAVSVRRGWDLDNLVAPAVSTLGDVVTVPCLWAATFLVGRGLPAEALALAAAVAAVAAGVRGWWSHRPRLREIVRDSVPVLVMAATLSSLAGLTLEHQLETLERYPALLVLEPAFVSSAGALGGLLSGSLSTSLHLGMVAPAWRPDRAVRNGMRLLIVLAVPVYMFNAIGANLTARLLGKSSPSMFTMLGISMLGAAGAVAFVLAVAYFGTIAAVRFRADPDTVGIPLVTSSVDFVGAAALIAAIKIMGVG